MRRSTLFLGVFAATWTHQAWAAGPDDLSGVVDLSELHIDDFEAVRVGERPQHAIPHTIFINFDGAELRGGDHNAQTDTTGRGACVGTFPAYGGSATQREAVVQATQQDWEAFAVTITQTRPASGSYTMVMSGNWGGCCGSGGVAPVICGTSNLNAIAFSCQGGGSPLSSGAQAGVISQEAAHTFGLMHVGDSSEIMNPSIGASSDPTFKDQCYSSYSPSACSSQHTCNGGGQNSYQELIDMFGAAVPDTQSPAVAITKPADGDVFEPGAGFDILAEASDDVGVRDVTLYVNDMTFHAVGTPPYSWHATDVPEGSYDLFVVATDNAMNETESAVITVIVGAEPPMGDTDGDGPGNGDNADDGVADDGSFPDSFGPDMDSSSGCGCTNPAPGRAGLWVLVLLVMGCPRAAASRRQRRARQ